MATSMFTYIFYGIIGYYVLRTIWEKIFGTKTKDETDDIVDSGLTPVKKKVFFGLIEPKQRIPTKVTEMDSKAFGFPYFYNEVDHTRGRFVHWFRKKIDEADERKDGLYRAKVLSDATFLWFFKVSRELMTPCVFRPGIDAIQLNPGEEPGVPPEGMVVFKRSMDGKHVSSSAAYNRWRAQVLRERHEKDMLDDMLNSLLSKDKLEAQALVNKETSDKMIAIMKRLNKIRQAAGGTTPGEGGMGYPPPYSDEVYGSEEERPEQSGIWNLEGGPQ